MILRSTMIGMAVLLALPGPVAGPGPEHRTGEGCRIEVQRRVPEATAEPTAASSPATHLLSPAPVETLAATPALPGSPVLRGTATWYRWRPGEAAAGPRLRRLLGKSWRGTTVTVRSGDRRVTVRLADWCGCPDGRIIDLDARSFGVLGSPSRGVLRVEVQEVKG